MKPTKEQLADAAWWEINSNGYDYMFYHEGIGEYEFTNKDGRAEDIALVISNDAWQLLAKRPEPEQWRPEVGVDCIQKMGGYDRKVSITYVGDGVGCYYDYKNEMEYTFSMRDSVFVPIKTQREEFVENAIDVMNSSIDDSQQGWAEALFDSGLFYLTEKDGE